MTQGILMDALSPHAGGTAGWFASPHRTEALRTAARQWLGTPWAANSAAPGSNGGVSCHRLPHALLIGTGALPPEFAVPTGDPNATRHATDSRIARWLENCPEFQAVPLPGAIGAGDLLGFRIHRCLDHLALALNPECFVHVLRHQRTTLGCLTDPTWASRLVGVWRLRGEAAEGPSGCREEKNERNANDPSSGIASLHPSTGATRHGQP